MATAAKSTQTELDEVKATRSKARERFDASVRDLNSSEAKKLLTLEGIERAKALSVDVAHGDLRTYIRMVVIPDEDHLRALYYTVDAKTISLLQTRADIVNTKTVCAASTNKQSPITPQPHPLRTPHPS